MKIQKLERMEKAIYQLMEEEGLMDFYSNTDLDFKDLGKMLLRIETLENYKDDDEIEAIEEKELIGLNIKIKDLIEYYKTLAKENL